MQPKRFDFASIPATAMRVVREPAAFFGEMAKTGGYLEPLVFMVIMSVTSGVLGGLLHALTNILGLNLYSGLALGMITIVLMPLYCAIGSAFFGFFVAGVLFVIWRLMGSKEGYETAYRCTSYLAAIAPLVTILWIIPYLGGALGLVTVLYYIVTASVRAHGIALGRAWIVFGAITALLILFSVSAQIAARRFARNMEQANESWKDATREMEKAAEEIRKQMREELEKRNQSERQSE